MGRGPVGEVFWAFVQLGLLGFGGPAAHLALMDSEFVERRGWMPRERFLRAVSVANLLPGPTSTEVAMLLGYQRAGFAGLFAAGAGFIVPPALLVYGLAEAYVRFGSGAVGLGLLSGLVPAALAVIADAAVRFWRTVVRDSRGLGFAFLALFGLSPGGVLAAVGASAAIGAYLGSRRPGWAWPVLAGAVAIAGVALWGGGLGVLDVTGVAEVSRPVPLAALAGYFATVGATLYGSGYVLVSFLQPLVQFDPAWLTGRELLDAVAIGQVTPGPLFTTATFVGRVTNGPVGALVATVAIFLPAVVAVSLAGPALDRLEGNGRVEAALSALAATSAGLIVVTALMLGLAVLRTPAAWFALVVSGAILVLGRGGPMVAMAAGGAAGWAASLALPS